MPNTIKIRAGEPQESFVRAVYAEMLMDKAEALHALTDPSYLSIDDMDNPEESLSPSAWSLRCYQDSFEDEVISRDLFERLSFEAKEVLGIFFTTPAEVTEALMTISITGESRRPDREESKITLKRLYKSARVKRYLQEYFPPEKVSQIFRELNQFFQESLI